MNVVSLLIRKDFRRLWPLALAAVLCAILDQILRVQGIGIPIPHRDQSNGSAYLAITELALSALRWPAMIVFIVVLVQEDVLVSERPFWRTRPIPRPALLAAKSLTLAVVVTLPTALARFATLLFLAMPATKLLALTCESAVAVTCTAVFFGLLAALTKTLVEMAIACLASAIGTTLLLSLLTLVRYPAHGIPVPWDSSVEEPGPRILVFAALLTAGSLCLFAQHYFSLRRRRTVAGLVGLFIVSILAGNLWTKGTQNPRQPIRDSEWQAGPKRVAAILAAGTAHARDNKEHPLWLHAFATIEGVKGGQSVEIGALRGKVTTNTGETYAFQTDIPRTTCRDEAETLRWLGELELALKARTSRTLNEIFPIDGQARPTIGAALVGSIHAEFAIAGYQESIAFRIPLRLGACYRKGGQRWTIRALDLTPAPAVAAPGTTAINLVLSVVRPTSFLIPAGPFARPWPSVERFVILARASETYTFSFGQTVGSSNGFSGLDEQMMALQILGVVHRGAKVPADRIEPAWFDDAELVGLSREVAGQTIAASDSTVNLVVQP